MALRCSDERLKGPGLRSEPLLVKTLQELFHAPITYCDRLRNRIVLVPSIMIHAMLKILERWYLSQTHGKMYRCG